ncbi:hypothetical protein OESDEN_21723 [Oesophagostomum dentatum]|uniref:Uncharacterized protein n=1 Tax=Oesophagostomum dentatum TaxID=61180 RepID=A0A0B1S170_OESDE|nr:hypothetical protein OESDEN_21723 [Oesophagostomum dentatum]
MLGIQDGSQPLRRRNKSSKKFVIIRTPKNEACFLPMTQNCDSKAAVEPVC